jgi:DNA-binding helix-hairpin-helix protein with protein kinase domain
MSRGSVNRLFVCAFAVLAAAATMATLGPTWAWAATAANAMAQMKKDLETKRMNSLQFWSAAAPKCPNNITQNNC